MTDWIQTFTGRRFFPLDPDPVEIDIRDIAHALSLQCRFNGHCRTFYCVADHSVRVAEIAGEQDALWGLLHDAAEAYVADLPRPFKRGMDLYQQIEDNLLRVIVRHFGLPWPMPAPVRQADEIMLATEQRDLMAPPPEPWGIRAKPLPDTVVPLTAHEAERLFLQRFQRLTGWTAAG